MKTIQKVRLAERKDGDLDWINSNLTGKFDKSGGTLSGDINLTDHKLNFVKGGTLGFYIYKDDSGKIGLYNHDNLLLAYFDFGGGLHMRSSIVQDIT